MVNKVQFWSSWFPRQTSHTHTIPTSIRKPKSSCLAPPPGPSGQMSLSKSSFSSLCQLSVSLREREKDVGILTTDSLEKEGGLSFPEDFKALSFLCRHLCPILRVFMSVTNWHLTSLLMVWGELAEFGGFSCETVRGKEPQTSPSCGDK